MGAALGKLPGCCCCKGGVPDVVLHGRRLRHSRLLGEGPTSSVYLVEDAATGQSYALKRVRCVDEAAVEAAVAEAERYALFDHSNILRLRDYGVMAPRERRRESPAAKDVFLLMPYLRAGTLRDLLAHMRANESFFTETEALALFISVCTGVRELHKATPALAHRDLQPGNILLNDSNVPVLTDFAAMRPARVTLHSRQEALALADDAAEHSAPAYRAPELFDVPSDGVVDERTDVWSLGCLLFAIAFGESPFDATMNEGGSVSLAVMSGRITFPRPCPFSRTFCDLISWMLNTAPTARPFIPEVIERARAVLREQLYGAQSATV